MGAHPAALYLPPTGRGIRWLAQYDRVLDALADKLPKVAEHLDAARAELLAFTAFPKQIWRQSGPTIPYLLTGRRQTRVGVAA